MQVKSVLPAVVFIATVLLLTSSLVSAQTSNSTESTITEHGRPACDISGTWYGGSVVAYQMTITPTLPGGHYIVTAEGMYRNSVINTVYTGEFVKKGNRYEGSSMQLTTGDPDFLNPPPIGKMPDLNVGWMSIELVDCNTIRNNIPFFGTYFASNIWQPGIVWTLRGKVPLIDPPDVDMLNILSGGKPIVETYHRLLGTVNPALLHK